MTCQGMMKSWPAVPTRHIDIDTSSYLAHRRPRHPEVVLNDAYHGLVLLNVLSGQRSSTVLFSPEFAKSGMITHWCFQSDGDTALLINEDTRTACYLTLDGNVCHDIDLPFDAVVDLRYIWQGEDLWLTSGPVRPWHQLIWTDGKPSLSNVSQVHVRAAQLSFWRALRQLPEHSTVMRIESEHNWLLLHRQGPEPALGVLSWSESASVLPRTVPFAGPAPRLAYALDTFYVLDEFTVQAVGISGYAHEPLSAEKGFEFADIDVVDTTLVVLGNALTDPRANRIWLYALGC